MDNSEVKARERALPDLRYLLAAAGCQDAAILGLDSLWDIIGSMVQLTEDEKVPNVPAFAALLSAGAVTRLLRLALDLLSTRETREELWIQSNTQVHEHDMSRGSVLRLTGSTQYPSRCRIIATLSKLSQALVRWDISRPDVRRSVVEWRVMGPRLIPAYMENIQALTASDTDYARLRLDCLVTLVPVLGSYRSKNHLERPALPYVILLSAPRSMHGKVSNSRSPQISYSS